MRFLYADIPRIAVENPVPSRIYCLPAYAQTIQPYEHGHPYTKRTCLWLKGLPKLSPSNLVVPVASWCPSGSYSKNHTSQHKGIFTKDRAKRPSPASLKLWRSSGEQKKVPSRTEGKKKKILTMLLYRKGLKMSRHRPGNPERHGWRRG